jgi:predicted nucleic acid-binding Zn ribbon protein
MNDPKFTNHKDVTEGHQGLKDTCDGNLKRLITGCAIIFKGPGWMTNQCGKKQDKIDRALAKMGVEDASEGWEHSDGKPKPKHRKMRRV